MRKILYLTKYSCLNKISNNTPSVVSVDNSKIWCSLIKPSAISESDLGFYQQS